MACTHAVPDETVVKVLGGYAGLVHKTTPASTQWDRLPVKKRVDWWLRRIAVSAGLAAAAPRLAGVLADRVPLQAALGASAASLAVCATAREHGVTDAAAWVPLLAKVLFDRDVIPRHVRVPDRAAADGTLAAASNVAAPDSTASDTTAPDTTAPDTAVIDTAAGSALEQHNASSTSRTDLSAGARRAVSTASQLARDLREVSSMLDERPSGLLMWRMVAKVPLEGVAGGWLNERGGIRRASKRTARLLRR